MNANVHSKTRSYVAAAILARVGMSTVAGRPAQPSPRRKSWKASQEIARTVALAAFLILAGLGRADAIGPAPAGPAPRAHMSSVYDEAHHEVLIYGGFTFDGKVKRLADLWAWDGRTWRFVGDTGVRKIVALMAFDSKRQRILMFGGAGEGDFNDGKLSVLDGTHWRTLTNVASMTRSAGDLVYDSKRDRLVMFGGRNDQVTFADTWEFDGKDWIQTWMSGPSLRSSAISSYDSDRGVTVLYGGFRPLAALGDTWEWDGKTWTMVTDRGPGPRSWPGLAYDRKRHRTVLFGGENEKGEFFNDTWAWDGKTWTRIATGGPPARIQFAMEYDAARDRIVTIGGMSAKGHYLGDVWEFDGLKWEQKTPYSRLRDAESLRSQCQPWAESRPSLQLSFRGSYVNDGVGNFVLFLVAA